MLASSRHVHGAAAPAAGAETDAAADTDKNEVISALEAYQYARRKTTDFYATQQRLATEHPLLEDTGSGHNIEQTVFIECRSDYRDDGPEHLRPIGETEFVAAVAAESRTDPSRATIAAIVGQGMSRTDRKSR